MKKTLALVLALVLMSACLLACGSGGSSGPVEIPGTWKLSKAKTSGITLPADTLGLEMTLTFNEDGTASMYYDNETQDGLTWELEGDVLHLGAYGITIYDFTFDGKTLTVHEDENDVDLIFSK